MSDTGHRTATVGAGTTFGRAAPNGFVQLEIGGQTANLEIRRVISRTCATLVGHPIFLALIALVALAGIPEHLVVYLAGMRRYDDLISKIVMFLLSFALQCAIARGVLDALQGEPPRLRSCLATGMAQYFPVFAITILYYLGIIAGALLLIVPGIILVLSWTLFIPVRVAEGLGLVECLRRSWNLTQGHRWKILALGMIEIFAIIGIGLALSPLWGAFSLRELPAFFSTNWLLSLLTIVIAVAGKTVLYDELIRLKEGGSPSQMASAFD